MTKSATGPPDAAHSPMMSAPAAHSNPPASPNAFGFNPAYFICMHVMNIPPWEYFSLLVYQKRDHLLISFYFV